MSSWRTKVWHDPVWSQVIAWGITGLLGLIGLGIAYLWNHPAVLPHLPSFVSTALDWLKSPVSFSHGVILLFWVAIVLLVAFLIWAARSAVRSVRTASTSTSMPNQFALLKVGNLTDVQKAVLTGLYRVYPVSAPIEVLLQHYLSNYPALERLLEQLQSLNLISTYRGAYNDVKVTLSKVGRDFCQDNGLTGEDEDAETESQPN